ncbi:MAG: UPF0149 family protein [Methyloprofundus sp.]|nr:UPF0149 family protein [Methyloprofundus sp.]
MLTQELKDRFRLYFTPINIPGDYFTVNELEGFMHALVITPDLIKPTEWLAAPFYGDLTVFDNDETAKNLAEFLMDCFSHYTALRHSGALSYPYDLKKLDEAMFDCIDGWAHGFWYGLSLRMPVWQTPFIGKQAAKNDSVVTSVEVFRALGDDQFDTAPLLAKIKHNSQGDIAESEWKSRLIINLMDAIPVSVHTLQEFGRYIIEKKQQELNLAEAGGHSVSA